MTNWPVRVTVEAARLSVSLRPIMVARAQAVAANRGEDARSLRGRDRQAEMPKFKLDGEIDEWGKVTELQVIGDPKMNCVFDMARDDKGLYMAVVRDAPIPAFARAPCDSESLSLATRCYIPSMALERTLCLTCFDARE